MTAWQISLIFVQAILAGLSVSPGIPTRSLGYIKVALDAATKGLAAAKQAEQEVDPDKLKTEDLIP